MKLLKLEFFKCRRRKIVLVCAAVLAAELLVGLLLLRRRPGLRGALLGHLICLAIAFLCLGKLIFAPADNSAGMASEMNSPIFALFGIF